MAEVDYRRWLPELKTTTLFQDIADDDLIALLKAMAPPVVHLEVGEMMPSFVPDSFMVFLKRYPPKELAPRRFKGDLPGFEEPGFLMGEIPCLSRFMERLNRSFSPHPPRPRETPCDLLQMNPDMLLQPYGAAVAPAQSTMLRNLLGILAQKVMDVRQDLFKLRDGVDIFNLQEGDAAKLARPPASHH